METSYYGKGDVTVYRLNRDPGNGAVFGANVLILIRNRRALNGSHRQRRHNRHLRSLSRAVNSIRAVYA